MFTENLPEVGSKKWFAMKPGEIAIQENEQFVMWLLHLKLITIGDATRSYRQIRSIAGAKFREMRERHA